jgi:hypothetical protein
MIRIDCEQTERRVQDDGEVQWEKVKDSLALLFPWEYAPAPIDRGNGVIRFSLQLLGVYTVYPKGYSSPRSTKVVSVGAFEGTNQNDWGIVADLQPRGYAEIHSTHENRIFHGPIKEVRVNEADMVELHFHWLATARVGSLGLPESEWEVAPSDLNPMVFPNVIVPYRIENTPTKGYRVRFGLSILYLGDVKGLDPSKVKGLALPAPT